MKIFKKYNDLILEQDGIDLSAEINAKPTRKDPVKKDDTKKDDTKKDIAPEEDTSYKTKEPYVSLIKLPGSSSSPEGTSINGDVWPHAVSWKSEGGQSYDPSAKAPVNTNKLYIFATQGPENKVVVSWERSSEYTPYLYTGTYVVANGKITISGLNGQAEVINIATGKFESTNVAVLPAAADAAIKEINTVLSVFSRQKYNDSYYAKMRMFNLKKEDPTLYKLIKDELVKKGYPSGKEKVIAFNQTEMTIDTTFFKTRTDSYWPIVNKFYSQFAPGQTNVVFGSIKDLSAPVHVEVSKGKRDFVSGYEYLAYKLEGADGVSVSAERPGGNQSNFSFNEAMCFFVILAGLSRSAIETLIKETQTFGVKFEGNLNWESNVLDEITSGWLQFYNTVIKGLQLSSGSTFSQESLKAIGAESNSETWFDSMVKINTYGGDYLKRAISMIPAYSDPDNTSAAVAAAAF